MLTQERSRRASCAESDQQSGLVSSTLSHFPPLSYLFTFLSDSAFSSITTSFLFICLSFRQLARAGYVQRVWIEGEGLNYGWGFIGAGGLSGPTFTVPNKRRSPAREHPQDTSLTRRCLCVSLLSKLCMFILVFQQMSPQVHNKLSYSFEL